MELELQLPACLHGVNKNDSEEDCLLSLITGKVKGKDHPRTGHEGPEVEYRYSSILSLTSALDGVGDQGRALAALPPGKKPCTQGTGGWVSTTAGLDGCGKSRPPPGFDPWTVQTVAVREPIFAVKSKVFPVHVMKGK